MKYLSWLACGLVMLNLPFHRAAKASTSVELTEAGIDVKSQGSCISERELAESLAGLSSPSTQERSHKTLIGYGRRSPKCRAQIVAALIGAMDKPALNLEHDQNTFFLWHYGGQVLAVLRASEALDLLIANLGVSDGESVSMTHFPAVATVIRIGSPAIPKLREKQKLADNAPMRKLVVFCLGLIGGRAAKQTLEQALPIEKDKCLNNFIQVTLKSFRNRQRPNHVAIDRGKWFSAFYCL